MRLAEPIPKPSRAIHAGETATLLVMLTEVARQTITAG